MKTQIVLKDNFPELLQNMKSPPKELYVAGDIPGPEYKIICVVGSRIHSSYGRNACEKLISGLTGYNIVIVSGLAIGMDSIAHQAALRANLKTIAFPGSGLSDKAIYPYRHRNLAEDIISKGGALMSQYPDDTLTQPYMFPARNRLMAGISHATLIIEARQGSGSLMTADFATEFDRDVLAVPGDIFSEHAYGPHMLIRRGAVPITCSKDILEALNVTVLDHDPELRYELLPERERKVIHQLTSPMMRDELIRAIGLTASECNAIIGELELMGYVRLDGNRIYKI